MKQKTLGLEISDHMACIKCDKFLYEMNGHFGGICMTTCLNAKCPRYGLWTALDKYVERK